MNDLSECSSDHVNVPHCVEATTASTTESPSVVCSKYNLVNLFLPLLKTEGYKPIYQSVYETKLETKHLGVRQNNNLE